MSNPTAKCLHCQRTSDEIPLIQFEFGGKTSWICPQHLPILIHKPEELADKLPGARFLDDTLEPQN